MTALLLKYGTQADIFFPMLVAGSQNLAATANWTPATGDTKISKDGGALANSTNNPSVISSSINWKLTLTATELTAKQIVVQIVDSATKTVEDQFLLIHTFGHASAMYPLDLGTALSGQTVGTVNAIAAGVVTSILAGALTETYPADGVAPTLQQALLMLLSAEFNLDATGVTVTFRKLDGTTSWGTATVNSSTAPTGITRST